MQKDDMEQIKQDILSADMVVFVTPLYYYGIRRLQNATSRINTAFFVAKLK